MFCNIPQDLAQNPVAGGIPGDTIPFRFTDDNVNAADLKSVNLLVTFFEYISIAMQVEIQYNEWVRSKRIITILVIKSP